MFIYFYLNYTKNNVLHIFTKTDYVNFYCRYMVTMLLLFGNFYIKSYTNRKSIEYKKTDENQNGTINKMTIQNEIKGGSQIKFTTSS